MSNDSVQAFKTLMGELNYATEEQVTELKGASQHRSGKVKFGGRIPVGLWMLLEAYVIREGGTRTAVITKGLEMFFQSLPPQDLHHLRTIIKEQLEGKDFSDAEEKA